DAACRRSRVQDRLDRPHLRGKRRTRQQRHRSLRAPTARETRPGRHTQTDRDAAWPWLPTGAEPHTTMNSLRARLLAATSLLLLVFVVLVGVALETAVRE